MEWFAIEKNAGKQENKVIDISEFAEINDEAGLLKFCQEKNKADDKEKKLDNDQKKALVAKIKENILSKGGKFVDRDYF